MDEHGYHILWLAEHHFQHEGYECIPNVLMAAVHLAHVTSRLRIGCGFNITPMWHPLRLAEDFATADILTGGRTVFGVGRGYHTREVETFGGPMLDAEANRAPLRGAGRHHHEGVPPEKLLAPGQALHAAAGRPVPRLPAPRAHAGAAPAAAAGGMLAAGRERQRARARLHDEAPHQGPDRRRRRDRWPSGSIHAYQEAAERAGLSYKLGEGLSLGIFFHIAESRERAVREITPWYEEHVKMFGPLGFVPGLTPEQNAAAMRRGGWARPACRRSSTTRRSARGSRARPRSSWRT